MSHISDSKTVEPFIPLKSLSEIADLQNKQSLIKGIAQNVARNNKPYIRLSECLECRSSTLQESDVCKNGTYPVYGANGIVGYLDNYNTEDEAVYIIKDGSGVGTVSYVTGKCSATGTLNILQAKDGYSLRYLYYLLKVFNFEPYKTGMAIPHIYFKDYGKAKIFCPSYTEQLQYARLLSAIDDKVSAEQNVLTSLSLQKQYLLRQIFI
jgi:type I restriction enzyme S subunit